MLAKFTCLLTSILVSASLISISATALERKPDHLQIGEEILSYLLEKDNSRRLSPGALKGKTLLLLFASVDQKFSTSALRDIQELVASRDEKNFTAIGIVSSYKGYEEVEKLTRQYHLHYQILYDAGDILSTHLGIIVYPSTLIINSSGRLAYYYPLYAPDYPEEISSHLDKIINDTDGRYLAQEVAKRKQHEALKKAREQISRGMVPEAVTTLNGLLEEGFSSFDIHLLLGYSLLNVQQFLKSLAQFRKAKEFNPESPMVDLGMGLALARIGQREKAIVFLNGVLQQGSIAHIAYRELALIHEMEGDLDKAIYYISKELDSLTAQVEE